VCTAAGSIARGCTLPFGPEELGGCAEAERMTGDALIGVHVAERVPGAAFAYGAPRARSATGWGFARSLPAWGADDVVHVAAGGAHAIGPRSGSRAIVEFVARGSCCGAARRRST
jgi:hypothetical protein